MFFLVGVKVKGNDKNAKYGRRELYRIWQTGTAKHYL